ncbi:MAG: HAMP domain-containing protein [Spirochaetota bacterium]|nr:MAG: HAMP domain-containing protein [Spirochaetota bacterium]
MKVRKGLRRESIILIGIISVFTLFLIAVIYISFMVEPLILLQTLTKNRVILIILLFIFGIMFLFVLYNLFQIVIDRIKNREGSKFRFRLTLFFLIIASIPIVPLSIVSNNLISSSIRLWFVSGIEDSLIDAVEVSKQLYAKFSEESIVEWNESCVDCTYSMIESRVYDKIDGVFLYDQKEDSLFSIYSKDPQTKTDIESAGIVELDMDSWKRLDINTREYLIVPAENIHAGEVFLVRKVPDAVQQYTSRISLGLQNYRTLKIIREPIRVVVILFYAVVTIPIVLLTFYLSFSISKDVTIPIKELAIATQKVASDKLDYKIKLEAKDELRLLIDSFNKMTEDLRVNKELVKHSERIAAWRDIARRVAHEIKNPLTPIKLSAERILKLYRKDDSYEDVLSKGINTIITEVNNINDMVNEFSKVARFPDTRMERTDIIAEIENIIGLLKDSYKHISFSFHHKEKKVYLSIDKNQIRRAFLNIFYNSINAITKQGNISVGCSESKGKENFYTIYIRDDGAGISEDIKERIFDPYFSKDGKGTGLGLTIVEKIILDNNGRIWFESRPGETTFYLEFKKA